MRKIISMLILAIAVITGSLAVATEADAATKGPVRYRVVHAAGHTNTLILRNTSRSCLTLEYRVKGGEYGEVWLARRNVPYNMDVMRSEFMPWKTKTSDVRITNIKRTRCDVTSGVWSDRRPAEAVRVPAGGLSHVSSPTRGRSSARAVATGTGAATAMGARDLCTADPLVHGQHRQQPRLSTSGVHGVLLARGGRRRRTFWSFGQGLRVSSPGAPSSAATNSATPRSVASTCGNIT